VSVIVGSFQSLETEHRMALAVVQEGPACANGQAHYT
jgi:hypothetical protein